MHYFLSILQYNNVLKLRTRIFSVKGLTSRIIVQNVFLQMFIYQACFYALIAPSHNKTHLGHIQTRKAQISQSVQSDQHLFLFAAEIEWAASSEFVSSSIQSWQILTAHAQPFRGARDLAFCLKVPLDSLLVWASSGGSGETAQMRRLAWTFAARIGDKY